MTNVLVVSRNEQVRRIVGLLLEGHGYNCEIVETTAAAKHIMTKHREVPDLLVYNHTPTLDGNNPIDDLLTLIRNRPHDSVKLIMLHDGITPHTQHLVEHIGGACILKPFDVDELINTTKQLAPLDTEAVRT